MISGFTIDQFTNTPGEVSSYLLDDDLLVVSVPDIYTNKIYNSRFIKSGNLLSNLLDELIDYCGFGTMLHEESDDYSLSNHNHISDYNRLSIIYSGQYETCDDYQMINIGNYRIDGQISSIYFKKQKLIIPDYALPEIGDLKFVGLKTLKSIDINASDFDGWVYPDGREFDKEKWKQAYEKFKDNHVPILTDFIKPSVTISEIENVPEKKVLKSHSHTLNGEIDGKISVDFELSVGSTGGGGMLFHGYSKEDPGTSEEKYTILDNLSCIINIKDFGQDIQIKNYPENESSNETYPTFNYCPVMIYIGKGLE